MHTYENCPLPVPFPTDAVREMSVGRVVVAVVAELPYCVARWFRR